MIRLRVLNVVGCRPNFIKIAPLMAEMRRSPEIEPLLVHTGQHYDELMSDVFFRDLGIPRPDFVLDVGSGSHAKQTAAIMDRFEDTINETNPDLVLVVGDVNSTVAASMTAVKMGIPVAHVEAGLRSFDREMPEEINRVMTDAIADFLFVTETSAVNNLTCEGVPASRIHFVGNVMIDTLFANSERILHSTIVEDLGLTRGEYAVLTLHRPSNVDQRPRLEGIVDALEKIQNRVTVVFPAHVRTIGRLHELGVWERLDALDNLRVLDPLGYLDNIALLKWSNMTLTDSGGLQEETTALQIPCLTLRTSTERPATVSEGTNTLVGHDSNLIVSEAMRILRGEGKTGRMPPMWDGNAAHRIVKQLLRQREQVVELYRNLRVRRLCSGIPDRAT